MGGIYRTLKRVEELESLIILVLGGRDHIVDRFLPPDLIHCNFSSSIL